jgi:hypothetical protein
MIHKQRPLTAHQPHRPRDRRGRRMRRRVSNPESETLYPQSIQNQTTIRGANTPRADPNQKSINNQKSTRPRSSPFQTLPELAALTREQLDYIHDLSVPARSMLVLAHQQIGNAMNAPEFVFYNYPWNWAYQLRLSKLYRNRVGRVIVLTWRL